MPETLYETLPEINTLLTEQEAFETQTTVNPESSFTVTETVFEPVEEAVDDQIEIICAEIAAMDELPPADAFADETYAFVSEHFDLQTGPSNPFAYEMRDGEYGAVDDQTGEWVLLRSLIDNYDEWLVDLARGAPDVDALYLKETEITVITITAMIDRDIFSTMIEIPGYIAKEEVVEILNPQPKLEKEKTQDQKIDQTAIESELPDLYQSVPESNREKMLAEDAVSDLYEAISEQFEATTGPSNPYIISKNEQGEYGAIDQSTGKWRSSRSLFENGTEQSWDYDEWVAYLESGGIDVKTDHNSEANRTWVTVNQLVGDSIVSSMIELSGYVTEKDIEEILADETDIEAEIGLNTEAIVVDPEPDLSLDTSEVPREDDDFYEVPEAPEIDEFDDEIETIDIDRSVDEPESNFDYSPTTTAVSPETTVIKTSLESLELKPAEIGAIQPEQPVFDDAQHYDYRTSKSIVAIREYINTIEISETPLPKEYIVKKPAPIEPMVETDSAVIQQLARQQFERVDDINAIRTIIARVDNPEPIIPEVKVEQPAVESSIRPDPKPRQPKNPTPEPIPQQPLVIEPKPIKASKTEQKPEVIPQPISKIAAIGPETKITQKPEKSAEPNQTEIVIEREIKTTKNRGATIIETPAIIRQKKQNIPTAKVTETITSMVQNEVETSPRIVAQQTTSSTSSESQQTRNQTINLKTSQNEESKTPTNATKNQLHRQIEHANIQTVTAKPKTITKSQTSIEYHPATRSRQAPERIIESITEIKNPAEVKKSETQKKPAAKIAGRPVPARIPRSLRFHSNHRVRQEANLATMAVHLALPTA